MMRTKTLAWLMEDKIVMDKLYTLQKTKTKMNALKPMRKFKGNQTPFVGILLTDRATEQDIRRDFERQKLDYLNAVNKSAKQARPFALFRDKAQEAAIATYLSSIWKNNVLVFVTAWVFMVIMQTVFLRSNKPNEATSSHEIFAFVFSTTLTVVPVLLEEYFYRPAGKIIGFILILILEIVSKILTHWANGTFSEDKNLQFDTIAPFVTMDRPGSSNEVYLVGFGASNAYRAKRMDLQPQLYTAGVRVAVELLIGLATALIRLKRFTMNAEKLLKFGMHLHPDQVKNYQFEYLSDTEVFWAVAMVDEVRWRVD